MYRKQAAHPKGRPWSMFGGGRRFRWNLLFQTRVETEGIKSLLFRRETSVRKAAEWRCKLLYGGEEERDLE